jgi:hypothetical protein
VHPTEKLESLMLAKNQLQQAPSIHFKHHWKSMDEMSIDAAKSLNRRLVISPK